MIESRNIVNAKRSLRGKYDVGRGRGQGGVYPQLKKHWLSAGGLSGERADQKRTTSESLSETKRRTLSKLRAELLAQVGTGEVYKPHLEKRIGDLGGCKDGQEGNIPINSRGDGRQETKRALSKVHASWEIVSQRKGRQELERIQEVT